MTEEEVWRILRHLFRPLLNLAYRFTHEQFLEVEVKNFISYEQVRRHYYNLWNTFARRIVCMLQETVQLQTVHLLHFLLLAIKRCLITELFEFGTHANSFIKLLLLSFRQQDAFNPLLELKGTIRLDCSGSIPWIAEIIRHFGQFVESFL